MNETPAQYRERILNLTRGHDPMMTLAQTPEILKALFEQKMSFSKKAGDSWNPAQILAHLAESEIVMAYRLRTIARNSGTDIQAFDQNAWIADSGYLINQPEEALQLFNVLRRINLSYLKSIPESFHQHYGMHSERGKETISDLISMYAGHDLNHLRQLEQRLS